MTGYVDIANAFRQLGPMFDELFGEGTRVWDCVGKAGKDKHGPQINLKELIASWKPGDGRHGLRAADHDQR